MPKKVLIFSLAYYPRFVGGAEVAVKEITDRLPDVNFHLITLRFDSRLPRYEKIGSVEVHRIGFGKAGAVPGTSYGLLWFIDKIFFVPLAALKGLLLHRTHHFDALWAMMTYMMFPIVLMRLLGNRLPYVVTLQDGDPFEYVFKRPSIRPFLPLLKYGFTHATVIQTISQFLAKWPRLMGYEGVVEVIPNGANVAHFAKAGEAPIDRKEGETRVITTSRLVHKNAIDDCIKAMSLLPNTYKFLILGDGPDRKKLERLVEELQVGDRVQFLGNIDNQNIPGYLHVSDVFVRPSRSEGMGNSFIEAMAAGIPVIATQEGGLSDFIFDQETAYVVEKDSPQQIAQKIKDIVENPHKASAIVQKAKELSQRYDWDIIARDMRTRVFSKVI